MTDNDKAVHGLPPYCTPDECDHEGAEACSRCCDCNECAELRYDESLDGAPRPSEAAR